MTSENGTQTAEAMTLEEQLTTFLSSREGESWKSADIADNLGIEDKRSVALALGSLHKDDASAVRRVDHGIYAFDTNVDKTETEPPHESHHEVQDAFLFEQDPTMVQRTFVVVAPHGRRGVLLMDDNSNLWIAKRAEVIEAEA